jgi:hypothetical protein
VIVTERSALTVTASGPRWEKSMAASTDPWARKSVRSPFRNDGRYLASFSMSTITWYEPVAARYS